MRGPHSAKSANVIVKEDTTIAPNSSALVKCRWSKSIPNDQPAVCVSALWVLRGHDVAICNPSSVLDAKKKPLLFVSNLGTTSAKVPSNMPIARQMLSVERKAVVTPLSFQLTLQDEPVDAEPFDHKDHSKLKLASDKFDKVDSHFHVGLDDQGKPIKEIVDVIRRHPNAFTLDGEPGYVKHRPMPIKLEEGAELC